MSFFETDFISSNMTHLLFSYGTLQFEKVQLESFGRILKGSKDSLPGYKLENLKITDKDVLSKSAQQYHPIAIPTKKKKISYPEFYLRSQKKSFDKPTFTR